MSRVSNKHIPFVLLLTKRANDTLVIMRFGERGSQNTSKANKESEDLYKQMARIHINAFSYIGVPSSDARYVMR